MHHSLRILPALLAFGTLATATDAAPRFATPAPYAVRLGCTIRLAKRPPTEHKILTSYVVFVVDTLGRPLDSGTTVLYGVDFSDGTTQNGSTSLPAPVAPGSDEAVGVVATPPLAPASCSAGIPPAPGYAPPGYGSGGYQPISSSPKPVVHAI